MIRPACVIAGLAAVLVVASVSCLHAQVSGPVLAADRNVVFSVCPDGGTNWTVLNEVPSTSVRVPAHLGRTWCRVRATADDGWFFRWEVEVHLFLGTHPVSLATQRRPRWPAIAGALGSGVVLLLVLCHQWRRLSLERGVVAREHAVAEEEEVASWFPRDGSLPTQIGSFPVLRRLGSGGMGVVYEVVGPRGERLALKLPWPHLMGDSVLRRRHEQEMRLGARLHHRGLVRIEGFEGGAYPFMVMEFVEGHPLAGERAGPAPLDETLQLAREMLEVLAYLHQEGAVHRDVKPANIMRTSDGRFRLMDLGVALDARVGKDLAADERILAGTPLYAAPEQMRHQEVDGRSDLYALGLVLYERLAGFLPFAPDARGMMVQKLTGELPPLGDARPDLPACVCDFVARLVASDREARWATAGEALDVLREVEAGEASEARGGGPGFPDATGSRRASLDATPPRDG